MKKFRTWLFVPGSNSRAMEKALGLDTDVIIYDLEDAVSIEEKEKARALVEQHLRQNDKNRRPYQVLRVNEHASDFFENDLEAGIRNRIDGIMLPKSEDPDGLAKIEKMLARLEQINGLEVGSVHLFPLIETALGVYKSYEIATALPRIKRLIFGAVDYTADIQTAISGNGRELLYAQSQLVNNSYAAGIDGPIDTVYTEIQNEQGLEKETERGRQLGFKGKMIIHPKQIAVVNRSYTPTEAEIQEAREIVNAYERAKDEGQGAVQLNGKMIDLPVVKRARQTLEVIENLEERS